MLMWDALNEYNRNTFARLLTSCFSTVNSFQHKRCYRVSTRPNCRPETVACVDQVRTAVRAASMSTHLLFILTFLFSHKWSAPLPDFILPPCGRHLPLHQQNVFCGRSLKVLSSPHDGRQGCHTSVGRREATSLRPSTAVLL